MSVKNILKQNFNTYSSKFYIQLTKLIIISIGSDSLELALFS